MSDLRTRIGLFTEVKALRGNEARAVHLLKAMLEETGSQYPKSDRCPMCWAYRGLQTDDALCARHVTETFLSGLK